MSNDVHTMVYISTDPETVEEVMEAAKKYLFNRKTSDGEVGIYKNNDYFVEIMQFISPWLPPLEDLRKFSEAVPKHRIVAVSEYLQYVDGEIGTVYFYQGGRLSFSFDITEDLKIAGMMFDPYIDDIY